MSYNISSWKTKVLIDLKIPVASLYKHPRTDWHPEKVDLDNMMSKFILFGEDSYINGSITNGIINVSEIKLSGEGSGTVMSWILKPALKDSKGKLIVTRVWENGDSIDRLTAIDGVITEKEIEV